MAPDFVIASEQRERGSPAHQHDARIGWIASSLLAPRNDGIFSDHFSAEKGIR